MQDKISEYDMAGTAGAAVRCAEHTSMVRIGTVTDRFQYSIFQFNILNSPDLQQDTILQIILAVIGV